MTITTRMVPKITIPSVWLLFSSHSGSKVGVGVKSSDMDIPTGVSEVVFPVIWKGSLRISVLRNMVAIINKIIA